MPATAPAKPEVPQKAVQEIPFPEALQKFEETYHRKPVSMDELKNPPEAPLAQPMVKMISIYPTLFLGVQAGGKETVNFLSENGEKYKKEVDNGRHRHIQFKNHQAWVPLQLMRHIRSKHGYGFSFVEAIPANDGDKRATSLSEWLKTFDGRGTVFLEQVETRGRAGAIRPVLKPDMVRQMIAGLENGTIKAPESE